MYRAPWPTRLIPMEYMLFIPYTQHLNTRRDELPKEKGADRNFPERQPKSQCKEHRQRDETLREETPGEHTPISNARTAKQRNSPERRNPKRANSPRPCACRRVRFTGAPPRTRRPWETRQTAASSEDRVTNYWHAQGHELALPRCHGSRLPPNTHDPNTVYDRCSLPLPLLRAQTNAGNGDDVQNFRSVHGTSPSFFSSPLLAPYLLLLAFLPSLQLALEMSVAARVLLLRSVATLTCVVLLFALCGNELAGTSGKATPLDGHSN
ncbi:hypothetical protein EDB85DRAFT_1894149 [Lactarius pseudohatsudake]|nr:hypothetical protein EDB85DRAFT_1894149 [Lactarius pseudohatsudake]